MRDTLAMIVVLAGLVGPLVYVTLRDRRRNQAEQERVEAMSPGEREAERLLGPYVPYPPEEALARLTAHLSSFDITATGTVGRTTQFERQGRLKIVLLLVLLIFLVIPAVIYVVWLTRREKFTVMATPIGEMGTRLEFAGDEGFRGVNRDAFKRFIRDTEAAQAGQAADSVGNLQILCRACNRSKGAWI